MGLGNGCTEIIVGEKGVTTVVRGAGCDAAGEWVSGSRVWREIDVVNCGGWGY